MSGGGGSQTSTTVNQADPRIWNAVERNVNRATGIADQPFQPYGGQMTAGLTGNQNQAISMAPGLFSAGAPAINQALSGAQSLMNTQNPWTEQVVDRTLGDIERQRQIQQHSDADEAYAARAFGGTRQGVQRALTNEAFAKQSGDTSAALRSGGFDRSLAATAQGAGLLGNLGAQQQQMYGAGLQGLLRTGGVQQGTQQAGFDAQLAEYLRGYDDPFKRQQLINQSLGLLPQGGTTTSTQPGPDRTGQALGLLGTAAMFMSDARCKADIETVGYDAKGRRWTTFRYNWEPVGVTHYGVIAQEILESDPDAVVMGADGFYRVDYSKLGTVH